MPAGVVVVFDRGVPASQRTAVRANASFEPSSIPNDPRFGELWGLQNTGQNVDGSVGAVPAPISTPPWCGIERSVIPPSWWPTSTPATCSGPDLGPVAWRNPGEIPGDRIDNDHNGYINDWRGWDTADNAAVSFERSMGSLPG